MTALRATQFFIGIVTGPGPTTLYTVPAGMRIVVHGLSVYNEESTTQATTVYVAGTQTLWAGVLAGAGSPGSLAVTLMYEVFNAGQAILIVNPSGKKVTVNMSGTLLFV